MKKSVYLVAVLTVLATYLQYEVLVYQALVPILLWSNNTLYLNVGANRMGWHNCKRFGRCQISDQAPRWKVIRHDAVAFRG